MKYNIKTTLIISTYNWSEALELVLISIKNQIVFPTEVIIADDGSGKDTKNLIQKFQTNFPVPLIHVWQEDHGFNKSMILNKAIVKASGDYIIQSDGDCILHSSFVKDHLKFIKKDCYLFGSRVNIQMPHLKSLFSKKQVKFHPFSRGIKKRTRSIHIPVLTNLYKIKNGFSKKFRGCNTSYFKSDFLAVNGYNEDFKGWGREDSELALRFHNYGLKGKRLRYCAIVFHIFHNEKSKDRLEVNNDIEKRTIDDKIVWCENGIDKYLGEA
ncbi:glycosyltransferase family 2 protein [Flavivirga spongiicola]|uniref:Glycosyltransferase family 2 protein n=1 Tax=Flavivirga spongiicola TaxID=421621 RepID=A0ABU7XP46_9FLAO|nr:glycosyltransferase family 2 protein [Flavivirga sp. MEBiC05379]MDO5977545.1 glycosyltransferase family 2 protein [Flavivirga sp. MEBiC05379]